MKQKIILITILIFIFFNINSQININVAGMWKDDNIKPKIKAKIHKLNKQFIDGFTNNKPETVFDICSDKLLSTGRNNLNMLIFQMGKNYSKEDFKILNEFYNKSNNDNYRARVFSGISGNHDYTIGFKAINKEVFVSVGYFDGFPTQTGFTFVYGKYGNKWKLNIIQIGIISIMGKDAFDWYTLAKDEYEKGHIIDAANNLFLVSQMLKPANDLWQYQKEEDILKFEEKVISEINTKFIFPMTVDYVDTNPQIYRIYPQVMNEGVFPMIEYTTSIELSDTISLAKENDKIHKKIGQLFKGIDKGKKMIFYSASKSIPTGYKQIETYGFIKYLKE